MHLQFSSPKNGTDRSDSPDLGHDLVTTRNIDCAPIKVGVRKASPHDSADYAGQVVLIVLSGPSWCLPCQFEGGGRDGGYRVEISWGFHANARKQSASETIGVR